MKLFKLFFWLSSIVFLFIILKFLIFSEKPIDVKAYKVKRGTIEEIVTNTRAGTLKARKRAKISPRTSGLVSLIPKKKGDFVKKGELILKLEDTLQRANLEAAEKRNQGLLANLKEAEVSLNLASKDEKRIFELFKNGIISEELYDKAKGERERLEAYLNSTKALLKQSEAEIKMAQEQLKMTETYAPFDGYISEVYTEVGEWVAPSFPGIIIPPVLEIIDIKELYVSAPIDEMDSKKIKLHNEARITLDSIPSKTFMGRVSKIGIYVQDILEQNRTLEVEIDLELENFNVLPGTSADVEIITERKENVLIIPTTAIVKENYVWAIEKERPFLKKVKIGLQNWALSEVLEGLNEGDIIISTLEDKEIKEGKKIKILLYD